jgi:hypothetical protein
MPVYKTLELNVHHVQARRILCEHCRQPFSYVWGSQETFKVAGVPILSSDEGMRKSALKKATAALAEVARRPNQGTGLCPHCKRYQVFMVKAGRLTGMGCGLLAGLALGAIVAFGLGYWLSWSIPVSLGLTAAVAVGGIAVGRSMVQTVGPHTSQAATGSLRDDEVPALIAQCAEKQHDPILYWYVSSGNEPRQDELVVSLGAVDLSRRPRLFPRELESDAVMRRLRAET